MQKETQRRSNSHLNSEFKSLEPINIQVQPQPNGFQSFANQNRYFIEAGAITSTNQSGGNDVMINNTDVQNSIPDITKVSYNEQSLVRGKPQNPRHINVSASHIGNLQKMHLPFKNPQSENLIVANPNYLDNKLPQSSWINKDSLIQNQSKDLTVIHPRDGDSMTHFKEDFRIYHCKVCSAFNTNVWQKLEFHIYSDRTRTPLDLIIPSSVGLACKLCHFKTGSSAAMAQHCTSKNHINLVAYYNHVREGGIHRTENLNLTLFSSINIFCSACECSINSMSTLKAHDVSPDHRYNVSCCIYFASFTPEISFCLCRLCNQETLSKRELLEHARSQYHKKNLQMLPPHHNFHDPRKVFCIKELDVAKIEASRISEQKAGNTPTRKEQLHLRKKTDDGSNFAENLASVNLRSSSSTSLQPQSISCSLCQQVFSEIKYLMQHLNRQHGVTEAGAEWLVSEIQKEEPKEHSEKSLLEEIPTDKQAQKVKCTTLWPERSSTVNVKSPGKRMSKDSLLYQRSDVTGHKEGSESSENFKVRPAQNAAIDHNSNPDRRTSYPYNTDSSTIQQVNEIEHRKNAKRLDNPCSSPYSKTCIDLSSSQIFHETEDMRMADLHQEKRIIINSTSKQQFNETEDIRNPNKFDHPHSNPLERTCLGISSNQKSSESEGMRNSELHQEKRTNTDSAPDQQFNEIKRMRTLEKLDNSHSSPSEQTCLDLASNKKSYKIENIQNTDLPQEKKTDLNSTSRQQIDETEGKQNPDLYQKRINMDSAKRQQFFETKNMLPVEEIVSTSEERSNSNSSEDEKSVEYFSESDEEGELEMITDDSSSDETKKFKPIEESLPISEERQNSNSSQDETAVGKEPEPIENNEDVMKVAGTSIDEPKNKLPPVEEIVSIGDQKLNSNFSQGEISHQYDSESFENSGDEREMDDFSTSDTGSLISLSDLNISIDSCSSDDNFEQLPRKEKQVSCAGNGIQSDFLQDEHNTLDTQTKKSPAESKQNQKVKRNVDNYINHIMALVESKKEINNSDRNLDHSVNDRMDLSDIPQRTEVHFYALSSPSTTDSQIQAMENIESIEISNVFSLGGIDVSSGTDDGDLDIYSDL